MNKSLNEILKKHELWMQGREYGKRADLRYADLRNANLQNIVLQFASLQYAHLEYVNLQGADLRYADLRGADLEDADLQGANLYETNLQGANLKNTNLSGAILGCTTLRESNIEHANLTTIKNDIWSILEKAKPEVPGLLQALKEGRVDGSVYEGECACLVGTIANLRNTKYDQLEDIVPNTKRPAECWFTGIEEGDTPENNPIVKITVGWVEEFLSLNL